MPKKKVEAHAGQSLRSKLEAGLLDENHVLTTNAEGTPIFLHEVLEALIEFLPEDKLSEPAQ